MGSGEWLLQSPSTAVPQYSSGTPCQVRFMYHIFCGLNYYINFLPKTGLTMLEISFLPDTAVGFCGGATVVCLWADS